MIYKKLGEVAHLSYGKMPKKQKIREYGYPIFTGYKISGYYSEYMYEDSQIIVVARGVGGTGDVKLAPSKSYITNLSIIVEIVDHSLVDKKYLQLLLSKKNLRNLDSGSAQSQITIRDLEKVELALPPKEKQIQISKKIKVLERKIELNAKINDNLDQLMAVIFENKIIKSNGKKSKNLTDIANYKNGLAMQKFRPEKGEDSLPVLKIRELNQGFTDNSSDRCTTAIDSSVVVNTGDIIFSWSGTLLVKLWSGNKSGLNQHLFKVTSDKYPNWFIYEWTKHYLQKFQEIAKDKATTMGHIKRSDLKASKVCIPLDNEMEIFNKIFTPLYQKRIALIKENKYLNSLKKELMNKYF